MKLIKILTASLLIIASTTSVAFALTKDTEKKIQDFNKNNQEIFVKNNDINGLNCDIGPNYLALGDYKNAIKYYSLAIEMLEKSDGQEGIEVIMINLALAQVLNDSLSDAEETINKSLKINPNYSEASYLLTFILDAKGEKEEALDLVKKNCENKDEISCLYLKDNKKKLSLVDFFKSYNDSRTEKYWNKK